MMNSKTETNNMTTANHFQPLLTSLLPQEQLQEMAHETGAVVRENRFCLWTFAWTLLFGFSNNPQRTLAGFHETYLLYADKSLSKSAFNDRFNPAMSKLFKRIFQTLLKKKQTALYQHSGLLSSFKDILSIDSTILRLANALQSIFKGVSTPSSIKINLVYSAKYGKVKRLKLAPGSHSETKLLKVGKWVKASLLLLDKGYYCLDSLQQIHQIGGTFIIPLKSNASPRVLSVVGWETFSESLDFQTVQGDFCGETFDAWVQFGQIDTPFRVVGLWNEDKHDYHWYLTNLDEGYTPLEIGILYRYRWMIELLFKQFKSGQGLDELPRARKEVIEVLIYAALCAWLLGQQIRKYVSGAVKDMRWNKLFCRHAGQLLEVIMTDSESLSQRLWCMLKTSAKDPNRRRRSLAQQVDERMYYGAVS